jgi:uncharacterized caspase-like protein
MFIAGHGLLDEKLDYYIATADVDFNNPSARGVLYDDLEGLIDGIGARNKLMLIDACHSGEVDKFATAATDNATTNTVAANGVKSRGFKSRQSMSPGSFELMQELFLDLRRGTGAAIISSASGKEFAFESDVWKNGVFTYSVLSAIKSGSADKDYDGNVSVSELRNYVIAEVQRLTNGQQTPTNRKENFENDFMVVAKGEAKKTKDTKKSRGREKSLTD